MMICAFEEQETLDQPTHHRDPRSDPQTHLSLHDAALLVPLQVLDQHFQVEIAAGRLAGLEEAGPVEDVGSEGGAGAEAVGGGEGRAGRDEVPEGLRGLLCGKPDRHYVNRNFDDVLRLIDAPQEAGRGPNRP